MYSFVVTIYYNFIRRNSQGRDISQLRGMRIRGRRPRLAFLGQNSQVFGVSASGYCCWELNSRTYHLGQTQVLIGAFSGMPNFQPKSIKKVRC